jgi:mRNA-degrading endonuclease RelE of RelBE toxin-antitoxin system
MVDMKSVTTQKFRKAFAELPKDVQKRARRTYKLWKQNSIHPSLHFKQVHDEQPIYSVRIGLSYRAIGVKEDNTMIWFWIGSHEAYNNLIRQLK